jgi:nucleotidyltransferase substrate binding protein (TIGR01987 family)
MDIRWRQRFNNYQNAIKLLDELKSLDIDTLSLLEKEGIIQRFEYTLELAWKTLKDKMEFDGLLIDQISPKMVMKKAYHYQYIDEIDLWLAMINDRNILSHTYNEKVVKQIIPIIKRQYLPLLDKLHETLLKDVE